MYILLQAYSIDEWKEFRNNNDNLMFLIILGCRNGIGEFEVLWCKKTNKLYLMDFNPRISADINELAYNKGSFLNNYINFMLGKPIKKHKHFSNNFTTIKYKAFKVLLKRVVDQDPLSLLNIFDWIYLLFIALCNLFKVIVNKI